MSDDFDGGSFCSCDFDGSWTPLSHTTPKARKRHKCFECGMHIQPGETYERYCGISEGEFFEAKTCPTCLAIVDWIKGHIPCFCRMYGGLWETMDDYVMDARLAAPGFAFGLMRRIVLHRRKRFTRALEDRA